MGAPRNRQGTQFSEHAYLRVEERLSLEPSELAEQLDYGFAINIKEEVHKDVVHRLFYSVDDSQCFIAIQNITSRVVVTILPVDYYEQRNPRIPPILMEDAKRLVSWSPATGEPQPLENIPNKATTIKAAESRFEVVVVVNKGAEWTRRTIKLKPWPSLECNGDAQRLLLDTQFQSSTLRRAKRVMVPAERVVEVKVRLSKKQPWTAASFNGQAFEPLPAKSKKRDDLRS